MSFRLISKRAEEGICEVYIEKFFKPKRYLLTISSLQALLGVACSKFLASYVRHIELVMIDLVHAKQHPDVRARLPIPQDLVRARSTNLPLNPTPLSQHKRATLWKKETAALWDDGDGERILKWILEKLDKLDSLEITSDLKAPGLFGARGLVDTGILTSKDCQAYLDDNKSFQPVLNALLASRCHVRHLRLREAESEITFLDIWTQYRNVWHYLHTLDICLHKILENKARKESLVGLLSTCGNLQNFRISFKGQYDDNDGGGYFSELVRSLHMAPLCSVGVTSMYVRKSDLDILLAMKALQSVQLSDIFNCDKGGIEEVQYRRRDREWVKTSAT